METIFPKDKGYKGFFLVGFRKDPESPAITQRTGTVVLKGTFDIDPVAGVLMPSADPLPVFIQDLLDNYVLNSDFNSSDENDNLYIWQPDQQVTIIPKGPDADDYKNFYVAGAANGRVVQTLTFNKPLGGRQFWLSFSAKSAENTTARIESVQLESNSHIICACSADLIDEEERFYANGTWPFDLQATEMQVVLRMATNSARTVFYKNVQVEERDHLTVWNHNATLRFENDIVAFKPEGDLIVLGFTGVAGLCRVKVNGVTWMQRNISFNGAREKAMFGWEPRINKEEYTYLRQDKAGKYSDSTDDYPLEWPFTDPVRDPLPGGPGDTRTHPFENIFYNGYRRTNADEGIVAYTPFAYLPASAHVIIERDSGSNYSFKLPENTILTNYYYYGGTGPDKENCWKSKSVSMNLDTLVVEPEKNRCYILWRGVWPFDEHSEGNYRRLEVKSVF